MTGRGPEPARVEELRRRLAAVTERIARGCDAAGRDPAEVVLLAVTKAHPAQDVAILAELGVHHVGESRDQAAAPKARELAGRDLRWHFVGQLQRNKCRSVLGYADVVESVDRPELASALDDAAVAAGRDLDVLLQVDLNAATRHDAARGGVAPERLAALADAVASSLRLRLRGVMAVAERGVDPEPGFARLAELAAAVRDRHPAATAISAGMSGDLEAALRHGSTEVRVGTALLGERVGVVR